MFTTRPRAFFTNGRNVLVTSTIPQRLTSARRLNVLTGVHSIGLKESMAALFTNPHSPANMQSERKKESWLIKDLLMKPEPVILLFILSLLLFMNEFLTNGNVALTYSLTKQYILHGAAPLFSSWMLAGFS